MKKTKKHAFGKDIYLLGQDKEGINYYLEEAKFDCGWYWGIGYVESYTNNKNPEVARDIRSHQHFDTLFLENGGYKENFDNFFESTPLTDKETWQLLELMKSAYIAREYSDMLHVGGAHITMNTTKNTIKNEQEYKRINEQVIPAIMEEVYKLLTE